MATEAENKTSIERPDWLSEKVWPFEVRSIDIEGNLIAYTDEGTGPVLLLVHDGMWSYVWGQLIKRLRHSFRVVTLDFPGSGLSPAANTPVGLETDSYLLEAFVDAIELRSTTLVLHDLGGIVGMGLAARRPRLIDGIVAVNTFAWPPDVAALRTMLRIVSSGPVRILNVITNVLPRLTSGRFGIGRNLDPEARATFVEGFQSRSSRRRFHDLMGAVLQENHYLKRLDTALGSVLSDKPVLTIYGERNDPFGLQAKFREYFSDVEELTVPQGNHFPMADDPDAVAERISDWHGRKVPRPTT